jgi:hypothetical protein
MTQFGGSVGGLGGKAAETFLSCQTRTRRRLGGGSTLVASSRSLDAFATRRAREFFSSDPLATSWDAPMNRDQNHLDERPHSVPANP